MKTHSKELELSDMMVKKKKKQFKKVKVSAQWSVHSFTRFSKKLQKNSIIAKVAFDFSQCTGPG